MKGYFITFEGGEGSGKTTQLARLAEYLEKKGHTVCATREPGGTVTCEAIRSILLDPQKINYTPKAELFLYLADRAQHLSEVILPALAKKQIVLCDRFTDSTLAYQGAARGLPLRKVQSMARFAANDIKPDLTLLLDIDVKKGLARLKTRTEINRLDLEANAFHQKVRDEYLALAMQEPERIYCIHADSSERQVFMKIRKAIDDLLQ